MFHTITASRKEAAFRLAPLGPRVWEFFWEVICQAKVIRERPLPGLAHAFVFWGFCAFALVTLNHLALGLGFGFIHPDRGALGPVYFGLAFDTAFEKGWGLSDYILGDKSDVVSLRNPLGAPFACDSWGGGPRAHCPDV